MEPVEINAGEYYLRAFRRDDRINDVPAIVEAFSEVETRRYLPRMGLHTEPAAEIFVNYLTAGWTYEQRVSWAVCDATTAELLAGVIIRDLDLQMGVGEITCWTQPAHRRKGVLTTALGATIAFAFGGLGVHRIAYRHAVSNKASQRIAEKCGFTLEGRLRGETIVDDQREDMLLWSRLATDPVPEQLR